MPFSSGENVGPYRIVDQLGQGGMASVYQAYHAALDRYVALKVLHPAFLEEPNFLARFQREARVVAKLEHPNIVPVYDFAEHQGQPYLVMKYIQGPTLKAVLARKPLNPSENLEIMEAVGRGLSYAHKQGVLHRDIKPSNVLLAEDGGIYLADFGLARIAQAGQSTLSSDMLLGTPQYISPEQARGEQDLDEGTDIYSLGVVLYEMTVGRVPFNADTPFSIIHDHIYTPLPMPRAVNPDVPERVERVLLKALAKGRTDRFGSVKDLIKAYRGAVVDKADTVAEEELPPLEPETLIDDAVGAMQRGAPRRKRWIWIAGGLVMACLCLFGFLAVADRLEQSYQAEAATATAMAKVEGEGLIGTPEPTTTVDDPRVLELRQAAKDNPDNPEIQIRLAQALTEAGHPALSIRHWLQAAAIYKEEGAFLEAAQPYNEAVRLSGGPQEISPQVRQSAVEALFMSAVSPEQAGTLLDRLQDQHSDWQVLPIIQARIAIYDGNLAEAIAFLEGQESDPADPLAQAVLIEAYLLSGRTEEARALAVAVLENPESPRWLRLHIQEIIRRNSDS
ncbi:MAG: protein kinase domain-containing protein [Anaerolineales bacterium]